MRVSDISVLIVGHGSRRPETKAELDRTAELLAQRLNRTVRAAFLELSPPSIPDGLEQLIATGARRILVLPWFLNTGRHLAEDIPAIVDGVQQAHPTVAIERIEHVGGHPAMVTLLADIVADALGEREE